MWDLVVGAGEIEPFMAAVLLFGTLYHFTPQKLQTPAILSDMSYGVI